MIDFGLFRDVLASEWTKLRTVRSTYWTVFAAIVVGVGFGALISFANGHAYRTLTSYDKSTFDPTSLSLAGLFFSQLALGVMAILTMTAEYSTGTIRSTVCAVPQRGYVLAAKAIIVTVLSLVVTLGIAFVTFFVGQAIFGHYGLSVSLHHPGVLRAIIGGALYMAALTVLALGMGTLIRHTAGAITALVGVVFILPIVTQALPDNWQNNFGRYLPANAGSSITEVIQNSNTLGPWAGYGVFVLWAAAALAGGWAILKRRDV